MSVPSPGHRRIVTFLAVIPWIVVLFQFLLILPRYNKIVQNLGLKLPAFMEIMFAVSAWLQAHRFLAFVIVFVLTAASVGIVHAVYVVPVSKSRRLLVLLLVFGLPCLLFIVTWVGVSLTQRRLGLAEGFDW